MKKAKFQASPLSRYGAAGSSMQHSDTITIGELREIIKENDIKPDKLFVKQDFLNDEKLMKAVGEKIELEDYRLNEKEKKKEQTDDLTPGDGISILTAEQKAQQEKDNELIPDKDNGESDNSLIPD